MNPLYNIIPCGIIPRRQILNYSLLHFTKSNILPTFDKEISKPPKFGGFKLLSMKKEIKIGNQTIRIKERDGSDYLSLTDLAKLVNKDTSKVLSRWISMVRTLEFLDVWERTYNSKYSQEEYQTLRMQAGVPSFFLSVKKWIEKTNATGIESKAGKYGGTFAHHLIALEFCGTMSSEFRFMVYKEYTELKQSEVDLSLIHI